MSRIFKSIVRELMVEGGLEVVRGYVLERMHLVKPADLYKAIKDGTHTMGVSEEKDRNFGRKWSKIIERYTFKGQKIKREYLTSANVLEWLKVDRPDLASLIINMNPEGLKWLDDDVKEIYKFLFSAPKPVQKATVTLVKRQPQAEPQPEPSKPPEPSEELKEETETGQNSKEISNEMSKSNHPHKKP